MRPGTVFPIQLGFDPARDASDRSRWPTTSPSATTRIAPGAIHGALGVVMVALAAIALWILSQPMEMRGIGFTG